MKVISEERLSTDGTVSGQTRFQMVTDAEPSDEQVAQAQERLGYNPAGYGGPWGIDKKCTPGGHSVEWTTKWFCAGSCD